VLKCHTVRGQPAGIDAGLAVSLDCGGWIEGWQACPTPRGPPRLLGGRLRIIAQVRPAKM